jgi:ornithine carbamoyltransferase
MTQLLTAADLTRESTLELFRVAADLKQRWKAGQRPAPLAGRTLALIFEKPSLRTRVTFEVGAVQLGGRAVYLAGGEIGLGTRESVPDVARNLSRWVDGIVARVFAHETVETLARIASIPVINALSDFEHPCQALADWFTLWERGVDIARTKLAWIGDGNNVCHSVIRLGAMLGARIAVACPPGYEPDARVLAEVRSRGRGLDLTTDPREAAEGADVLYTDVWVSMGQEAERRRDALPAGPPR